MAEALADVPLVASTTNTFFSTIQCLHYIQFGRDFGSDFSRCHTGLEALKLRLSRWATSVGILPSSDRVATATIPASKEEIGVVVKLLTSFLDDLMQMQKKSASCRRLFLIQGNRPALELYDESSLTRAPAAVMQRAGGLLRGRKMQVGLATKPKWALYDKSRFDYLVQCASETLSELEKLFPFAAETLRQLAVIEVEAIGQGEDGVDNLGILADAVNDQPEEHRDGALDQALRDAIERGGRRRHHYVKPRVVGKACVQMGDVIQDGFIGQSPRGRVRHIYNEPKYSRNSRGQLGDMYRRSG